jgi:ferredoxin, 2Fe-2S
MFSQRKPELTVHLVDAQGHRYTIGAKAGQSLMRAAVDAGIDGIAADCGGSLSCATCHVMLDDPWRGRLPPVAADEAAMLEMTAAPREPGSRLSCQIVLGPALDGLEARMPTTQY